LLIENSFVPNLLSSLLCTEHRVMLPGPLSQTPVSPIGGARGPGSITLLLLPSSCVGSSAGCLRQPTCASRDPTTLERDAVDASRRVTEDQLMRPVRRAETASDQSRGLALSTAARRELRRSGDPPELFQDPMCRRSSLL
jgi:hypothetical protein